MFERSLNDKESGLYLGDIKVVDKLVGEFINTIATNTDINVVYRTITRLLVQVT